VSKRKEKLKGIVSKGSKNDRWSQDYSAKGEYIAKGGMMGHKAIFEDEEVTVLDSTNKGKKVLVTKTTKDTSKDKTGKIGKTYSTAKDWYSKVLIDKSMKPMLGESKAFKFNGKIYAINQDAKGRSFSSESETQV
tara:strand:- start:22502 stop:22906 length:405 start_codon:yes stop_codon:yes gene_type:complete